MILYLEHFTRGQRKCILLPIPVVESKYDADWSYHVRMTHLTGRGIVSPDDSRSFVKSKVRNRVYAGSSLCGEQDPQLHVSARFSKHIHRITLGNLEEEITQNTILSCNKNIPANNEALISL